MKQEIIKNVNALYELRKSSKHIKIYIKMIFSFYIYN